MTLCAFEELDESARSQNRRPRVGEVDEMTVSRDERVCGCRSGEGDEVIIIGIGGSSCEDRWIVEQRRRVLEAKQERCRVGASDPLGNVRPREHVFKLLQECRRDDDVESSVTPHPHQACRKTMWRDQPRDKDPGVDHDLHRLSPRGRCAFAAHRMQLRICELERLFLAQVVAPSLNSLDQSAQRRVAQRVLDHLGYGPVRARGRDAKLTHHFLVDINRGLHLRHHRSIAVMKERR